MTIPKSGKAHTVCQTIYAKTKRILGDKSLFFKSKSREGKAPPRQSQFNEKGKHPLGDIVIDIFKLTVSLDSNRHFGYDLEVIKLSRD